MSERGYEAAYLATDELRASMVGVRQFPRVTYPRWHMSAGEWHTNERNRAAIMSMLSWWNPFLGPGKVLQDRRIAKLQAIFGTGKAGTTSEGPSFETRDSYTRTLQFAMRDVDALPPAIRKELCGTAMDGMPGTTGTVDDPPCAWVALMADAINAHNVRASEIATRTRCLT